MRALWRPGAPTHRTLPDQLWWNFSPIPLFLATCAPNISKLVAFTPFLRRAQCDRRGAPLGKRRGEAPSQGVRPFAVAQGASHPAFLGGRWGHVVPNPRKSYLRLVWHQYVVGGGYGCTRVPRKKNGGNGKTKFPTLLDRIFARPISPNWYAHPPFFRFHCKVHIK